MDATTIISAVGQRYRADAPPGPEPRPDCDHNSRPAVALETGTQATDQWDPAGFADDQISGLIQRVFFPGWPKPAHQVVFIEAREDGQTADVCARVARAMAAKLPGTVCAADADIRGRSLERMLSGDHGKGPALQAGSVPQSPKLAILSAERFFNGNNGHPAPPQLQMRMSELRRQFDYVVINAPRGDANAGTLLGQFADGVILVVQAQSTRRAAALVWKETLQAANVRLLGVVLAHRKFPIPRRIYRWL